MSKFSFNFKKAIFKAFDDAIEDSNRIIGAKVVAQAKSLQQPDTGALRNSIMYTTPKVAGGFNNMSGEKAPNPISSKPKKGETYVGSNLDYAVYQELGTRHMKAQPYLQPAIDIIVGGKEAEDVLKDMQQKVKSSIDKNPFSKVI